MKPALSLLLVAFLLTACSHPQAGQAEERAAYLEKIKKAEALFQERCQTVAGVRIHKTVSDVDGVLLMKVRPMRGDRELSDRMWPGAAFGKESRGEGFITTFLGYEYSFSATGAPVTPQRRGYINVDRRPDALPGYRWVEVIDEKDGRRYRYTGSEKIVGKKDTTAYNVQLELKKNPKYDLNVYRWSLDKVPAPKEMPRYGVTYDDHLIPEERDLWIASSTVRVIDLQTNEVLGEMTRYAMSYIHTPRSSMPWLNASVCPLTSGDAHAETRQFVDQILIPRKEQ